MFWFLQMLIALRWFAKGGHLSEVAGFHGVSKSTVSRTLDKVTSYFVSIANQHIHYPQNR